MLTNCLRHPLGTLRRIHASLVHRLITANLEQAREHAANGNHEGFERHCGHAKRLAQRQASDRVGDVETTNRQCELVGDGGDSITSDGSIDTCAATAQSLSIDPETVPVAPLLGEDIDVTIRDGTDAHTVSLHVGSVTDTSLVCDYSGAGASPLVDDPQRGDDCHLLVLDGSRRDAPYLTRGHDGSILGIVTGLELPWTPEVTHRLLETSEGTRVSSGQDYLA